MSDGADGLLGSLTTISLISIFIVALVDTGTKHAIGPVGIALLVGAMCAFILFNSRLFGLKRAVVFMGDAGSTTLGFILAYLLIDYSQVGNAPISPVVAGWIIGLPLLDASGVILRRVLSGKSPFHPDRTHLHHLIMDAGYSVNHTVLGMLLIHAALISFSLIVYKVLGSAAEPYLFWGFVALVACRASVTRIHRFDTSTEPEVNELDFQPYREQSELNVTPKVVVFSRSKESNILKESETVE